MKRIVVGSVKGNAGKTSIIAGIIMSLMNKNCSYIKPVGDRLIRKGKINFDSDSRLITDITNSGAKPEELSLGFDHCKLKYKYNNDNIKNELIRMAEKAGSGKDILFIEGGRTLSYGASVLLDPFSLSVNLDAELIIVVSGNEDMIIDELTYMNKYMNRKTGAISGVIINRVNYPDDFKKSCFEEIKELGFKILGVIPFRDELNNFTVRFLTERINANIIAGEKGLNKVVKNILVGAMSSGEMLRHILFRREKKLIITSGDRSDIILTALESDTSAIVLSNDILPPANIISMASEKDIPLMTVKGDTFQVAKQIDDMEPLLSIED